MHEHLKTVYSQLVEQNLLRVLEPFSRVELQHVATLVGLHPSEVQRTVSRMILDKKLHGASARCSMLAHTRTPDLPWALQELLASPSFSVTT